MPLMGQERVKCVEYKLLLPEQNDENAYTKRDIEIQTSTWI